MRRPKSGDEVQEFKLVCLIDEDEIIMHRVIEWMNRLLDSCTRKNKNWSENGKSHQFPKHFYCK